MPRFVVVGKDAFKSQPWRAVVEGGSAAEVDAFVRSRFIVPVTVIELGMDQPAPPDTRVMRVPRPRLAKPASPVRRRVKLVMLGIGLALLVIAGTLFVNRAKEHLLREREVPLGEAGRAMP